MNESVTALEHIRLSITRAEALRMRSSAVLVADLKILLKIAESAVQATHTALPTTKPQAKTEVSIGD